MYFLLLLSSLLVLTTVSSKSVYYVRPDIDSSQNYSPSTYNLYHYLLNASKYFTSNSELKFLPGEHHLGAVITIKDVHHFSLIESSRNGTVNSIVKCLPYSAGGIVLINCSYIHIKDLILKDCKTALIYGLYLKPLILFKSSFASLLINNSYSVNICHVTTLQISLYNIVLINVFNSSLDYVSSNGIAIIYNSKNNMNDHLIMRNRLLLHHYRSLVNLYSVKPYEMVLNFIGYSSGAKVEISNVQFQSEKVIFVYSYTSCNGTNEVTLSNSSFDNIRCISKSDEQDSLITMYYNVDDDMCNLSDKQTNFVTFINCYFGNIINDAEYLTKYIIKLSDTDSESVLCIVDSWFYNISGSIILTVSDTLTTKHSSVIIKNVTFSQLMNIDFVMVLYDTNIKLEGPVLFSEMEIDMAVIIGKRMDLVFSDYIEFADIDTFHIIVNQFVYLTPNTYIHITSSNISQEIFANEDINDTISRPCMLQYTNSSLHQDLVNVRSFNISIIITTTIFYALCANKYCITHCGWVGNALFNAFSPLVINRQIIKTDQIGAVKMFSNRKRVCFCKDNFSYNYYLDEINSVYPGQTLPLHLISTVRDMIHVTMKTTITSSCWVTKNSEIEQRVYNNCTLVHFTIRHYKNWCELFLSYPPFGADIFYVNLLSCPLGFTLNHVEGYCQCDPILTSTTMISIISCNINDQTILCPSNSYICITSNFTYQVSSHCPFRYCLPHSSSFSLSNPDSQCQFNRTGLLCRKCKKGLSTVFGTFNCVKCSNTFSICNSSNCISWCCIITCTICA